MSAASERHDPEWLNRAEFPFEPRWWKTPHGTMHYVDEGEGAPVVLVHGVPGWSFHFRHLIRNISSHRRCIALDHLGFGLSDKPRDWSYSPRDMARNVEGLIEGLGLKAVVLVVHDWGGPLGLSYALRKSDNVAGLVIFNTWLWSSSGDLRTRTTTRLLATGLYRWFDARFAVSARLFPRMASGRKNPLSAITRAHFYGPFRDPTQRSGLLGLVRSTHTADGWVGTLGERRETLRGIPSLVVWGTDDPAFPPRFLDRWRAILPEANVAELPGAGHYPFEERPTETGELISEFLRDLENPGG